MTWDVLAAAIRGWVLAGSGLPDESIIWENQDGPRPTRPFISIAIGQRRLLGIDAVVYLTDLTRAAGQEVEAKVLGQRSFDVRVQAYTPKANALPGTPDASAILGSVQLAASLPTVLAGLTAAGLAFSDWGKVTPIPTVLDTGWEGRAFLDVKMMTADTVSEYLGYIDEVDYAGTVP